MLPRKQDTPDVPKKTEALIEDIEDAPEDHIEITATQAPESEPVPQVIHYGLCRITAYCSCERCCGKWAANRPRNEAGEPIVYGASGEILTPGVSVASSLPYGTKLCIAGIGDFEVQDRPAERILQKYDNMIIDVYFASHEQALEFAEKCGMYREVYIYV